MVLHGENAHMCTVGRPRYSLGLARTPWTGRLRTTDALECVRGILARAPRLGLDASALYVVIVVWYVWIHRSGRWSTNLA
jgi:hypothetical protein